MDQANRSPAIRVLMMPRDANPAGTIFGGLILSYMDQAGAEEALLAGAERVVTVAMQSVVFHEPVYVGDLVSFFTERLRTGRTSVAVRVVVDAARSWDRREMVRVTEAEITYVNVDPQGNPRPLVEHRRRGVAEV